MTVPNYLTEQGVTLADYERWNSLTESQRQSIALELDKYLDNCVIELMNNGMSEGGAMNKTLRSNVTYHEYPLPDDIMLQLGVYGLFDLNDWPLPWELSFRVNSSMRKFTDNEQVLIPFRELLNKGKTVNAVFRMLIKEDII